MDGPGGRFRVQQTLKNFDFDRALSIAREIRDPWYRCQSLSYVAEASTDKKLRKFLLEEALTSAYATEQPNRIVTVGGWPLRLMCRYGQPDEIALEVANLLRIAAQEDHPIRRLDAVFSLHFMVSEAPVGSFWAVLDACIEASLRSYGWKRDRALHCLSVSLIKIADNRARAVTLLIDKPRLRRRALRTIEPERQVLTDQDIEMLGDMAEQYLRQGKVDLVSRIQARVEEISGKP